MPDDDQDGATDRDDGLLLAPVAGEAPIAFAEEGGGLPGSDGGLADHQHGLDLSVRALLDALAGIEETVLLSPGARGRPKARRMITDTDPLQQQLFNIFHSPLGANAGSASGWVRRSCAPASTTTAGAGPPHPTPLLRRASQPRGRATTPPGNR
ncbi:MAG: hypothetical protein ACRDRH_00995 [Pseudonocardia sp.]